MGLDDVWDDFQVP